MVSKALGLDVGMNWGSWINAGKLSINRYLRAVNLSQYEPSYAGESYLLVSSFFLDDFI